MKNKKIMLMIILFILFFLNNYSYGSFADYTDEDGERDTQSLIQEHKEQFDSNKSENNYLKDLYVEGETLSPNFDKQILEYSLKVKNNTEDINIIANAEDEKAKVKGTGRISINSISEIKIEVVADSGTTRTYFIKIIKDNDEDKAEENKIEEDLNENTIEESDLTNINPIGENISELEIEQDKNIKKYIIISIVFIVLLTSLMIIIKLKNKKSKH